MALRVLKRWDDQEERWEDSRWEAWEERLGRLEDIVEDGDKRRKDSERGRARDDSRCWWIGGNSSKDLGVWDEGNHENRHGICS